MVDEKDRLGDKLREKEKAEEDRFFKQRDQEAIERLRREKAAPGGTSTMRCPKDGTDLLSVDHLGIAIEECPTCHGMWLDQGECETLAKREHESWISRFFFRPRL